MWLGWKDKLILILFLCLVLLWLLLYYTEPEKDKRQDRITNLAQEMREAYDTIRKPTDSRPAPRTEV